MFFLKVLFASKQIICVLTKQPLDYTKFLFYGNFSEHICKNPVVMSHPDTIFSRIERYLLQRQALGGDIAYAATARERTGITAPSPSTAPETASALPSLPNPLAMKQESRTRDTAWKNASSLPLLYDHIHQCQNCKLGATRTNFVFGTGNPNAKLMIIGEAPGADEDAQGEPFVGRAGQLLTKILEAIQFHREDVYIANIIKCRPPENRRPEADEVAECEPYLYKQIDLVQPKVILAVGLTAVNTLLKSKHTMGAIRGQTLEFRGIPMIATYHPAALLRNPEWKKATWEDVQTLRKLYDTLV